MGTPRHAVVAVHLPAALWALGVGFLMTAPASAVSSERWPLLALLGPAADKLGHFGVFAILVWLVHRSLRRLDSIRRPLALAAIATLLYSVLLETCQLWVPGRGWSLLDLLAGAAGVALAASWAAVRGRGRVESRRASIE